MKDSAVISLLMFSVVSDSCLSCLGKALPRSKEEQIFIESSNFEENCNPPTNCAAWVDCLVTCEQIYWEDIESNEFISDDTNLDEFRERCIQYCDLHYLEQEEQELNACTTNQCDCNCEIECSCYSCDEH